MVCIILNFRDTRRANTALWYIDNALNRQIILAVVNRLLISKNILDLLARIKVHPSDYIVRNIQRNKTLFQQT